MAEATIKVTGMMCPKCEARVEKGALAVPGVEAAKADHEAETVVLTYDGSEGTLAAAKAAIDAVDEDFKVVE